MCADVCDSAELAGQQVHKHSELSREVPSTYSRCILLPLLPSLVGFGRGALLPATVSVLLLVSAMIHDA